MTLGLETLLNLVVKTVRSYVGAERPRLHFDGFNGKENNGKGKMGVSSQVNTGLVSVAVRVYRTTDAVGL